VDIGGQIAFIQEGIDCFGPSPGAEAILKSIRLVPKLMKVVEAARLHKHAQAAEVMACDLCEAVARLDESARLAALDAGEGAQEIAERRGYETPSEGQQRLNQDRNIEDLSSG
jgi:hypothetical protein